MSEIEDQEKYISRGTDHLGFIGAQLRDLQGYATLAFEFIQNADDAPGAASISFDIRNDALIVDNDGTFSDCKRIKEQECPWKEDPALGHRCDFHRFRYVASGDKRNQSGTTGAFGIGFISVYQITDRPELISSGRHWIINDNQEESKRIEACPGCSECKRVDLPGTRFILPWALDQNSSLRKALKVEAVQSESLTIFERELIEQLPASVLFLKKINLIEVKKDNQRIFRIERTPVGDNLIVSDGQSDRIWYIFKGDFKTTEQQLRQKYQDKIEPKRTSDVIIAIPNEIIGKGLFCASLPTEQETGLQFHINADFFTTNDRKRIILGSDYQSEWNRAAIEAAAKTLATNIDKLPKLLGHKELWELLKTVHQIAQETEKGQKDVSMKTFWNTILKVLPNKPVIYTTTGEWRTPKETLQLEKEEEERAIELMESCNIPVAHFDLRPHQPLLRSEEIGVKFVDIPDFITGLNHHGLNKHIFSSDIPVFLNTDEKRTVLLDEIELLYNRRRRSDEKERIKKELKKCAIACGIDGGLWPCEQIFRADLETIGLFNKIDPNIPFMQNDENERSFIKEIILKFSAISAIDYFKAALIDNIKEGIGDRIDSIELFKWFENRKAEILNSDKLKALFCELPIIPCSTGLRPLTELSLPGNFKDELGLANLVDMEKIGNRRDFLKDVGARELTFIEYITKHIPVALSDKTIQIEKKRKVINMMANRLSEIKASQESADIKDTLEVLPIVECQDGVFREPKTVYLKENVKEILGDSVHIAKTPSENKESLFEFYDWLGARELPTLKGVVQRVRELTKDLPNDTTRKNIQVIVNHLGERFERTDNLNTDPLEPLCSLEWLPAKENYERWFLPQEVFNERRRHIFSTQAYFIDLPYQHQQLYVKLLKFLGIRDNPTANQVISHLLRCSEMGIQIHTDVYRFLNDEAQEQEIRVLKGKKCLLLPTGQYVEPEKVFWSEHPFSSFRYRLGPDLRSYNKLFTALGVKDVPDHEDALNVLHEIAQEIGSKNQLLNETEHAVVIKCWQMLSEAYQNGKISQEVLGSLSNDKCIPDKGKVLELPSRVFFEDRAGLVKKFEGLLANIVIPRPQNAWIAMEKAGVEPISKFVEPLIVERDDPDEDEFVTNRLQERKEQLSRVFGANDEQNSISPDDLENIDIVVVRDLKIQYELNLFSKKYLGEAETVPAHYHNVEGEKCLYYVKKDGNVPWPAIARELVMALAPNGELGRLAIGIKDVLAAGSEEEARKLLDELGFPVMVVPEDTPTGGEIVTELGGDEKPQDEEPAEKPGGQAFEGGTGGAIEGILGPGVGKPMPMPPMPPEKTFGGPGSGAGPGAGKRPGKGSGKFRRPAGPGRMRTYVSHNREEKKDKDREAAAQRDQVDQAGVNRVLEYEREQGRTPTEMPHNHPGYDIESKDMFDSIVRYIEVKALSDYWDKQGVALSKEQFEKARDEGNLYWLYVVERAEQDDFRIYRIQNPANKANQFFFDDGWSVVAEEAGYQGSEMIDEENGGEVVDGED